jgi:hypothetical protein
MKKSLILLVVLAALIGVAVWSKKQKDARLSEIARRGVKTRELLVPDLRVNDIKKVIVSSQDANTTLIEGENGWVVDQRYKYPADIEKLSRAIMALREMKVGGKQIIGRGAWAGANLLEPAEGVTDGVGTQIKLTDAKDGEVANFILGGDVATSGGNSTQFGAPAQRLVRVPADEDTIWMINSNLGDFQAKPEEWLDKSFVNVQNLKSLEVTLAEANEAWTVSRASDIETSYTLVGAKAGEELDESKLALSSLLTSASFNDVKPKAEAAELLKTASKAKITTFEGFVYDFEIVKESKDGADKYFMAVAVTGNYPKERQAQKDEKEEDKKRLDDEFKAELTRLNEKLEKEQKLAGWVYEVAEYTVNNLIKKRSEIVKAAEAPVEAPPASLTPSAPTMPAPAPVAPAIDEKPPGISVTTPPIAVPPVAKDEVKPAPAPDANPADAGKNQ